MEKREKEADARQSKVFSSTILFYRKIRNLEVEESFFNRQGSAFSSSHFPIFPHSFFKKVSIEFLEFESRRKDENVNYSYPTLELA